MVMLAWGFGIGTQIIVARRNGEKKYKDIGRTVEHGLFFLFPLALLMFSLMKFLSSSILTSVMDSEAVLGATLDYINIRSFGLFFVFINILFRSFYIGIARTRVISLTTGFMAAVNIFLDWCLIFGNLGFPEMGIEGAALASIIAESSATAFFLIYTLARIPRKKYRLFYFMGFRWELFTRIIRVSFPIMMQNFLSLASWLTFFLMIEKMGERDLAISNIIRSFYIVLMIPMWGFASATNTLVSQVIGEKRQDEVMSLIYKIMMLCLAGVSIVVAFGYLFPELAIRLYTNDPVLIAATKPVLYVINAAAVLLSGAFIFFNGVSGTGKTQVSFLIEVAVLAAYLTFSYLLINFLGKPIHVVWMAEWIYAAVMALLAYLYLKSNRWKGATV
jgi:putative MATE family efflux protein